MVLLLTMLLIGEVLFVHDGQVLFADDHVVGNHVLIGDYVIDDGIDVGGGAVVTYHPLCAIDKPFLDSVDTVGRYPAHR